MDNRLRTILQQSDTVIFVGSGISSWSGLPRWSDLIIELAEFLEKNGLDATLVRTELMRHDLLQAASYGFDQLTRPQIGEFIRGVCRAGKAKPHEIHRRLITLGPKCFITTNYDKLLEASLRTWRPDLEFRVVSNRQLTETAEIIQARATTFVFKPHGDVDDSSSIILTREQYRALLPGGELNHTLESLRTLLISRPVVYIGFGLRDPDFLLIRDLLANTYKGGVRDHYAIMADVTQPEIEYWRRNYGIHLVQYSTTIRLDHSQDHSALLALLADLAVSATPGEFPKVQSDELLNINSIALSLMRHANRLAAVEIPTLELPLHVHPQDREEDDIDSHRYYGARVEYFLDAGPNRAILIGHPGSGKSYALRHSAARLANILHKTILDGNDIGKALMVPIIIDLKLYDGALISLIDHSLPEGLSFNRLAPRVQLKIFIDAFNEMPRDFIESGKWEHDFNSFLAQCTAKTTTIIIASRTADAIEKLKLPVYALDELGEEFVRAELNALSIIVDGRFQRELYILLQKPFYFKLVTARQITLNRGSRPADIYLALLSQVDSEFQQRFKVTINLQQALKKIAFEAIDYGNEAISVDLLVKILGAHCQEIHVELSPQTIINWLVSKAFLLPYSAARIAFFHQSVTEFLAATELATRYLVNPRILEEKLRWRRWDQALFLTVDLLPSTNAQSFIDTIIDMDFALAVSAVKFMESGSDIVVRKLLQRIPRQLRSRKYDYRLEHNLEICFIVSTIVK